MNLINTLITRHILLPSFRLHLLTQSSHFSSQKQSPSQSILKEYDKKIQIIRKIKDPDQRHLQHEALVKELRDTNRKKQQDENLDKIKSYLMEGFAEKDGDVSRREREKEREQEEKGYIPANLVVKKLKFLDKRILMLGVEEQNQDHCIYVKKMAQKMNAKIILTALPPDMPYFIKTQQSYNEQWKKFVTDPNHAKQSKFYLNPTPNHISQFSLSRDHIQLVRGNLNKSKQFNEIFYTILQYHRRLDQYLPNALLTPLLVNGVEKVYFCDFPVLKERELWALTIPLPEMRNLFRTYHRELYKDKKMIFDPRILFPKQIIRRKFEHMANAVKFTTYETNQPTVFVCPAQYAQQFSQQFKKNKPVSHFSNFTVPVFQEKPTIFIDFIQKLVIMDLILEPVIEKYFVKNVSFPYSAQQTLGGKQNIGKVFMVWNHYANMYKETLAKMPED